MDKQDIIDIVEDHLEYAYALLPRAESGLMTQKEAGDFADDFINDNYDLVRDWVKHEEAHAKQLANAGMTVEHPTIRFEKFAEQWEGLNQKRF